MPCSRRTSPPDRCEDTERVEHPTETAGPPRPLAYVVAPGTGTGDGRDDLLAVRNTVHAGSERSDRERYLQRHSKSVERQRSIGLVLCPQHEHCGIGIRQFSHTQWGTDGGPRALADSRRRHRLTVHVLAHTTTASSGIGRASASWHNQFISAEFAAAALAKVAETFLQVVLISALLCAFSASGRRRSSYLSW